jgi:phosphoglycolate phosphatase
MRRAVIFDLDGTLVDTLGEIASGLNKGLATVGARPHAPSRVRGWVGAGVDVLVARALPAGLEHRRGTVVEEVERAYEQSAGALSRPYAGIEAVVRELSDRGTALAVLTNKPQAIAEVVVERYFPGLFASVVGVGADGRRKPSPEPLLELLAELGVSPGGSALVGDSEVDVETARRAGVAVAAVTWGFRSREQLAATSPNWLIDDPARILALEDPSS